MKVHVHFDSQVRRLAGCKQIVVEVEQDASLSQIAQLVALNGTEALRSALLDEHKSLRPSILVFLDNELIAKEQPLALHENAALTFTTLISGG